MIEEVIIFGIVNGALLALLALGFSLVYGVGGVLNLSHGAFYLMAAYIFYWSIPLFGIGVGIVIALGLVAAIGAITYLGLIRPLQETHIGVVLITFALAFFFEQFVKFFGDPRTHYIAPYLPGTVHFLGIEFQTQLLGVAVGSIILVTVVSLIISKTTIGKSIRAVSQDYEAAKLMGINTDMILLICLTLSAVLAGFAAILYAPGNFIAPRIGWRYLLLAFAVTIFGGMGSIPGSIIGAYIMGFATSLTNYLIDPAYTELIPIVVILVMLLVRPQGLLGKKEVT